MELVKNLKIAQVTDIHIGPENKLYNNIDVRKNFLKVLEDIKHHEIDYLIISGDLAIDFGEIESYIWIKEVLDIYPIKTLLMAGNHDSVDRMSKIFDLQEYIQNGSLYYKKDLNGLPIIFLDSEPDAISINQLEWLKKITKEDHREHLLFIHHPPCYCDSNFMDRKYSLRNIPEVQEVLYEIENIKNIFVGHYHTESIVGLGEKLVFLTPGTQMQISRTNPDFEISDYRAGWRKIIWDGEELQTQVFYIE